MKALQVSPRVDVPMAVPVDVTHRDLRETPPVGLHIIAELYGVDPAKISFVEEVASTVERIVQEANLTRIESFYHQFEPHGVTGIVLLAESHVSLHTWPEHGMVNLDIFTCGDPEKAKKAFELFLDAFQPRNYRHIQLDRG